jgi:hypothetical protein
MRYLTWLCYAALMLEGIIIGIAFMRPLTQGALPFGVLSIVVLIAFPVGLIFRQRWAPFAVLCFGAVFSVYVMHVSFAPEIVVDHGRYWVEQIALAFRDFSGEPRFWAELALTGGMANLPSLLLFLRLRNTSERYTTQAT